ncbi:hypothetical protein SEA_REDWATTLEHOG_76 [Gordonia phage RedWattleHog]|uniref:Uncharacterized protein n=1 Tax=Gordonia phage Stormageddon TaxID=2656541 RepID=A0A649VR41_9CAUD|nr:hypothetical protein KHQ86_gp073 [Gordonia phage Stormageddon]QGJ94936.1 hypothetical protein SEA_STORMAGEDDON_73 [Gordonia phage Stormageddon]QLF83580.1 hypothetical protein SEA_REDWATTLEHOG_76 [Gordonia phage RedWattleHog]
MADDNDELNYDVEIPSVIGGFDDAADREAFEVMQADNAAYAEKLSQEMTDKGVPPTKKPL